MNIYEHVSLIYMNIHKVNQISLGLREHDRCLPMAPPTCVLEFLLIYSPGMEVDGRW